MVQDDRSEGNRCTPFPIFKYNVPKKVTIANQLTTRRFPGYAWTIANCGRCRTHLGWRYTAVDPRLVPSLFWGLRRSALRGCRPPGQEGEREGGGEGEGEGIDSSDEDLSLSDFIE